MPLTFYRIKRFFLFRSGTKLSLIAVDIKATATVNLIAGCCKVNVEHITRIYDMFNVQKKEMEKMCFRRRAVGGTIRH
jgi:hypothetical protein